MAGLMFPKQRPALLDKRDKAAAIAKVDRAENGKVRKRSGGRCEVYVNGAIYLSRCTRKATETHHLIGGSGRRNRGESIKAEHKLRVCRDCHRDITGTIGGKKLVPVNIGQAREWADLVLYQRAK
jgi:hypothetical protein